MKVDKIYLQVLYWILMIFLFFDIVFVEEVFLQQILIFETNLYFVMPNNLEYNYIIQSYDNSLPVQIYFLPLLF